MTSLSHLLVRTRETSHVTPEISSLRPDKGYPVARSRRARPPPSRVPHTRCEKREGDGGASEKPVGVAPVHRQSTHNTYGSSGTLRAYNSRLNHGKHGTSKVRHISPVPQVPFFLKPIAIPSICSFDTTRVQSSVEAARALSLSSEAATEAAAAAAAAIAGDTTAAAAVAAAL